MITRRSTIMSWLLAPFVGKAVAAVETPAKSNPPLPDETLIIKPPASTFPFGGRAYLVDENGEEIRALKPQEILCSVSDDDLSATVHDAVFTADKAMNISVRAAIIEFSGTGSVRLPFRNGPLKIKLHPGDTVTIPAIKMV